MEEYIIKKEFMYEDGNTYSFTSKVKKEIEEDQNRHRVIYSDPITKKVDVVYIDIFKVITKTINLYFYEYKYKKHIPIYKNVRVHGYVDTIILPTELSRAIKRIISSSLDNYIEKIKEENKFSNLFNTIRDKFGDEVGNIPQEFKREKNINEILE